MIELHDLKTPTAHVTKPNGVRWCLAVTRIKEEDERENLRPIVREKVPGMTDEELLERFYGGDDCAFDELYHRYHARLYCSIRRRVRNGGRSDADAEDVVQEVFLLLYKTKNHVITNTKRLDTSRYKVSTWLYNQAFWIATRQGRARQEELPDGDFPGNGPRADEFAIAEEDLEDVRDCLEQLDWKRELAIQFWLALAGDATMERLGEILGVSTAYAWKTFQAGLRDVRRCVSSKRLHRSDQHARLTEFHNCTTRLTAVRSRLAEWDPPSERDRSLCANGILQDWMRLMHPKSQEILRRELKLMSQEELSQTAADAKNQLLLLLDCRLKQLQETPADDNLVHMILDLQQLVIDCAEKFDALTEC